VIEGRSPQGEEFGIERLAWNWEQEWASERSPEEVLRRVVQAVSEFCAGRLRDDATLLQLCWYGPTGGADSKSTSAGWCTNATAAGAGG
jgi:hypothetical protein